MAYTNNYKPRTTTTTTTTSKAKDTVTMKYENRHLIRSRVNGFGKADGYTVEIKNGVPTSFIKCSVADKDREGNTVYHPVYVRLRGECAISLEGAGIGDIVELVGKTTPSIRDVLDQGPVPFLNMFCGFDNHSAKIVSKGEGQTAGQVQGKGGGSRVTEF